MDLTPVKEIVFAPNAKKVTYFYKDGHVEVNDCESLTMTEIGTTTVLGWIEGKVDVRTD